MYKNRAKSGRNNLCGKNVRRFRKSLSPNTSQRILADMLQREGLDVDKNAIQRIEAGSRFVTDIEVSALAKVLNVSYDQLLDSEI